MAYKLSIVEEELDESLYWIELLVEHEAVTKPQVAELMREGNELLAMIVTSIKTLRKNPQSKT